MDTFPAIGATVRDGKSLPNATIVGAATFAEGKIGATSLDLGSYSILGSSYSQSIDEERTISNDGTGIQTFDHVDDMNGTVTQTASSIAGNVSQASTNQLVANYVLDINGFGSIQYSDGSMAAFTAFAVQH